MSISFHNSTTTIGPPPPYDSECAVVLDAQAPRPELTAEQIPLLREANKSLQLSDEELTRDGRYVIAPHTAVDAQGIRVPLLMCFPTETTKRPAPAIYYIHGGGMIAGSNRDALDTVLDLAASIGAAVAAVDYRLAPETPYPGPVEDCYTGLSWLVEHATDLHIDPDRVVLLGGSAGGGLSASLSLLWRDRAQRPLAGQLLMSPMLDNQNDSVSVHQMAGLPIWNRSANDVGWTAFLGTNHRDADLPDYAVPLYADDFTCLPPTFIDVGSADTFRDEDIAFAHRIWSAGGKAELHVWAGGFHGSDGMAPNSRLSIAMIATRKDWLCRTVK